MSDQISEVKITSYTKSQLADMYKVSIQTFLKWIKGAGLKTGRRNILTPSEVKKIFDHLGKP